MANRDELEREEMMMRTKMEKQGKGRYWVFWGWKPR